MNPNEQLRRFHTAPADARRLLPSGRMHPNDAGVAPMPAAARARPAPAESTPPYAAATAGAGASSGPPSSPAALATDPAAPVGDLTTAPPTPAAGLSDASSSAGARRDRCEGGWPKMRSSVAGVETVAKAAGHRCGARSLASRVETAARAAV